MVTVVGPLPLLLPVLGSSVLEPDLHLTIRETDRNSQLRFSLDRDVLVVEELLLQLNLLKLSVDDPIFVLRTSLT